MKDYMKDPIYQISKMPDTTDQDGIDEDKRELEQEDRLKKIEDFLFTTSRGDKTLEDLITRICLLYTSDAADE